MDMDSFRSDRFKNPWPRSTPKALKRECGSQKQKNKKENPKGKLKLLSRHGFQFLRYYDTIAVPRTIAQNN
jgi:hypothetical protein